MWIRHRPFDEADGFRKQTVCLKSAHTYFVLGKTYITLELTFTGAPSINTNVKSYYINSSDG
jgi:hypothetical protein